MKTEEDVIKHFGLDPRRVDIPTGWVPMMFNLLEKLFALGVTAEQVFQIKEKFGTLRVYLGEPTPETSALIAEAEKLSELICVRCGEPGNPPEGQSFYTVCELHVSRRA